MKNSAILAVLVFGLISTLKAQSVSDCSQGISILLSGLRETYLTNSQSSSYSNVADWFYSEQMHDEINRAGFSGGLNIPLLSGILGLTANSTNEQIRDAYNKQYGGNKSISNKNALYEYAASKLNPDTKDIVMDWIAKCSEIIEENSNSDFVFLVKLINNNEIKVSFYYQGISKELPVISDADFNDLDCISSNGCFSIGQTITRSNITKTYKITGSDANFDITVDNSKQTFMWAVPTPVPQVMPTPTPSWGGLFPDESPYPYGDLAAKTKWIASVQQECGSPPSSTDQKEYKEYWNCRHCSDMKQGVMISREKMYYLFLKAKTGNQIDKDNYQIFLNDGGARFPMQKIEDPCEGIPTRPVSF